MKEDTFAEKVIFSDPHSLYNELQNPDFPLQQFKENSAFENNLVLILEDALSNPDTSYNLDIIVKDKRWFKYVLNLLPEETDQDKFLTKITSKKINEEKVEVVIAILGAIVARNMTKISYVLTEEDPLLKEERDFAKRIFDY